ncbi:hypothetical protein ACFPOD_11435 [Nitratireductor kimnyeongensis]|uniref:Transposase n=1 Tax=Nitratireductor kimnyeongensis TaxID=430679 RepID=A0ABW0TAP1_9HYPH|nr:hypothetical protein [Nitratireductor kimnyeongensis]
MTLLTRALKAVRDFAIEFDAMTHHAKYGTRPTKKLGPSGRCSH